MFEDLDPSSMSPQEAMDTVVALRAEMSRLAALDGELLVRVAGATRVVRSVLVESDPVFDAEELAGLTPTEVGMREVELVDEAREEIAARLRLSPTSVYHQIERARLLHGPLARTRASLAAGRISPAHVSVICEHAARMHPGVLGHDGTADARFHQVCDRLQDRVLPVAERTTPGTTRTCAVKAVAVIDAAGEAERRARAKRRRDVYCRPDTDGLGIVIATLSASDAVWVDQLISGLTQDTIASGDADLDPDATLGEIRAAAFLSLLRGQAGGTDATQVGAEVQVVIDLATLTGITPGAPAFIDCSGEETPIGRDDVLALMADSSTPATLRRLVSDPLTGALIDRGATKYQASDQLTAWLQARDQTCRFPGCTRRARGCDIDHATDYDSGGLTTIQNTGALCRRHHNLKTHGNWRIEKSEPDGTCEFISPTGRTYHHEPVRLLPEPEPEPPPRLAIDPNAPLPF